MSREREAEIKNCQNCKKDFTIEPDDFAFYEKIKVPPPVNCPRCRFIIFAPTARRLFTASSATMQK
ncbi:MAG: hypothetical protein A3G45_02270 [Candidatus Staskawiczbacteria bacterium RIFCSPLOWO2_12_FULL_37_15]|uniref:Zinc-binding domain-containing protein n=1 Tax=Candidatus Staskawiczbacteria bacterium RIFCSPLOWO2_12_FULL_37_15 TaxID=1802218 RepID=A0A1G2IQS9_9BACT|nr:MAG: hypothetical protein US35_C0001G0019 [Parcubacteria group bacterium GW2011_GWA2_37_10]OGZ77274.1 MAG: hypothetical protein A3G45_02270 [Candidatus Staskawiczbacteria bacterium RIFCSPLOWO2_12_FULL_37_15]